ncbi:MAG: hypothetical protein SFY56_03400 [Bacteroidota bacterium]|nr:hypothetical protein [Bacteroidota bacterium]
MKLFRNICAVIVLLNLLSCRSNDTNCVSISEKELSEMLSTQHKIKDTLIVTFSNNPFGFGNKDYVSLSINNVKTTLQKFSNSFIVDKALLKDSVNINIAINRYVEQSDKTFCSTSYQNKETVLWVSKYKYLYVSFSPTNDNTDEVQFYLSDVPAYN